jgi:hypothetical protein
MMPATIVVGDDSLNNCFFTRPNASVTFRLNSIIIIKKNKMQCDGTNTRADYPFIE